MIAEIEKTFKKVAEGVEIFEGIFEKLQQATSQGQKDKLESDLKKEIKKLQRLRDQIKTWASSNEIKDKRALLENRKLIETLMERFKATERELKTKAYSQAGLTAASKVDPEEKEKDEIRLWIAEMTDKLSTQIDMLEAEQEAIRLQKKGRRNESKDRTLQIAHTIERHKHHQNKLEIILRMLENGNLTPDQVNSIRDDVAYYVDENQEPEYEEDEGIYDDLNLEEAEYGISAEDEDLAAEPEIPEPVLEKKKPEKKKEEEKKPAAKEKKTSLPKPDSPSSSPVPSTTSQAPVSTSTATPASTAAPRPLAPAPVEPNVPLAPKYAAAAKVATPKTSVSEPPSTPPSGRSSTTTFAKELTKEENTAESLENKFSPALVDLVASFEATKEAAQRTDNQEYQQTMLEASFSNLPDAFDSSKPKHYFPKNPYPVPGYYPQVPLSLFESSAVIFERFDIDTLFFIFYFRQGSLQQYLAARELKRQSWRFHKKFMTWFQRHEEPKNITEEYEEGTYIYFDYEEAWCQRKKTDFRFEYRYLEDEI